jgi:hypothetical protein
MRRLLPALLLLLIAAVPAHADDAGKIALALRTSPVYQAPGLNLVDVAALSTELSGRTPRIVVAVLPAGVASSDDQAQSIAIDIGAALGDPDAVVLVITMNRHLGVGQGHAAAARQVDARAALAAERGVLSAFTKDNLTAFVTSVAERVQNQASTDRTTKTRSSSHLGAWLLGGLVLLGAAAAGVVAARRRRRAVGPRDDVEPFLLGGILPGVDSDGE